MLSAGMRGAGMRGAGMRSQGYGRAAANQAGHAATNHRAPWRDAQAWLQEPLFSCSPLSAASRAAGLWGSTISTLPFWARAIS